MKRSYSSMSSSSSSSSFSSSLIKYDVFLSFRGEDTRNNFTSHLYAALHQKGIYTFKDNHLERGQSISQELLKTIESSRCSVVVLSGNYASSSWCLNELVKILECNKDYGQIVLPIFYHVDPSHVQKQIGSFGEPFKRYEQVFSHNMEKVQSWRDALTEVGNLAGNPLYDGVDEAKFIEDFSEYVSKRLGVGVQLNSSEGLVGMDSRLKQLDDFVGMDSGLKERDLNVCPSSMDDVRFIGICGMGGIGKTTLAKVYHKQMSSKFEGSSFLANVREVCEKENNGLVYLQNHLLSDILHGLPNGIVKNVHEGKDMIKSRLCHKKVLIVLDDVDKLEQLKALAEKDYWFGSGSRIIVTTRDENLLQSTYKECMIYRVDKLDYSESLQLLSWKAFKSIHPLEDYRELAEQVISYANGLPLALEVLGSFLCGKGINEWKSALDRLKEYPKKEIVKVLQISFDGLEETEKSIFLDIACFFNGFDKDNVIEIMDSCGFFPEIGIRVLIDKSLIYDAPYNRLQMHNLLEDMGKEIVREKSRKEPGRWSRIWDLSDLYYVMENNTGTEEVEAIVCRDSLGAQKTFRCEALSNMKKLRLLILNFSQGIHDFTPIAYFSNDLWILKWDGFPFTSFPSSFQPDRHVELRLQGSSIEQVWNSPIKRLDDLKIIDLSWSANFSKFEDFGVVPNLEKLILQGCRGLVEVHPSITLLKRLTLLDLNYCFGLENLPTSINGLESLKVLQLSFCRRLHNLAEDLGHLNSLEELYLGNTCLRDLPHSFVLPKNLRVLYCGPQDSESQSKNMIDIIVGKGLISGCLYSLKKLDLRSCSLGDGAIPEDFGCLASLEELDLSYNNFSCLPASMNQLSKLRILDLSDCENLESLGSDQLPPSLEMVRVDHCTSLNTFLDPLNDQCNLRCSASCVDCFELVRWQGSKRTAFASLKRYLQNPPNPSKRIFDIVLPGKEIPAWFTYRNLGSSISFEVDPNWCSSKWMGFVFFVLAPAQYFSISVRTNIQDLEFQLFENCSFSDSKRDHLGLIYFPRDICFHTKWQNNCSRLEFSFESNTYNCDSCKNNENGCGVRLVYEQDIQDLNFHYEDEDEYENEEMDGDNDEGEVMWIWMKMGMRMKMWMRRKLRKTQRYRLH